MGWIRAANVGTQLPHNFHSNTAAETLMATDSQSHFEKEQKHSKAAQRTVVLQRPKRTRACERNVGRTRERSRAGVITLIE